MYSLRILFTDSGLESGVRYEVMVLSGTRAGFPSVDEDTLWSSVVLGELRPPEG